mmetsp:Transcript_93862/g.281422  ORF Transcript_93862/g.281422 Transcript_93862/m.281422 type:complete len:217 (+) Transcript_93862:247-897(+)
MEGARAEGARVACGRAVREVARRPHDAHLRRRVARPIGRQLHHNRVLDERKILDVLVHVKAGRLERVRRLPQPVGKVELDDGAVLLVEPADEKLLDRGEAGHLLAHERQQRVRDQKRVRPLLLRVVRGEHLAVRRVAEARLGAMLQREPATHPVLLQVCGARSGALARHRCRHHAARLGLVDRPREQRLNLAVECRAALVDVECDEARRQPVRQLP